MPVDLTFTEARQRFQSISGLESLTSADTFFLQNSFSRSALNAYHMSNLWPRFLRVNELRGLNTLSEDVSIYPETIKLSYAPLENVADGQNSNYDIKTYSGSLTYGPALFERIDDINGFPAWGTVTEEGWHVVIARRYYGENSSSSRYNESNYGIYQAYSFSNIIWTSSPAVRFSRSPEFPILPYTIVTSDGTDGLYVGGLYVGGTEVSTYPDLFEFNYPQSDPVFTNIVPYSELNKDDIGEFIRISKDKAYDIMSTVEYDFYVDSNGANLRNLDPGTQSVYVTYKKAYNPSFTEASTDIPQEFLDYMIHIALSDFYMGDGQNERAYAAKGHAERLLTDELYRLEQRKNTNIINTRFFNHHNKQVR